MIFNGVFVRECSLRIFYLIKMMLIGLGSCEPLGHMTNTVRIYGGVKSISMTWSGLLSGSGWCLRMKLPVSSLTILESMSSVMS